MSLSELFLVVVYYLFSFITTTIPFVVSLLKFFASPIVVNTAGVVSALGNSETNIKGIYNYLKKEKKSITDVDKTTLKIDLISLIIYVIYIIIVTAVALSGATIKWVNYLSYLALVLKPLKELVLLGVNIKVLVKYLKR